jgi:hypothetical protein
MPLPAETGTPCSSYTSFRLSETSAATAGFDRADRAHPDSLVAVGDGEPFGEGDGGVLGERVGRVAGVGEQASGRAGLQQVAVASLQHLVDQRAHGRLGGDVDAGGRGARLGWPVNASCAGPTWGR